MLFKKWRYGLKILLQKPGVLAIQKNCKNETLFVKHVIYIPRCCCFSFLFFINFVNFNVKTAEILLSAD